MKRYLLIAVAVVSAWSGVVSAAELKLGFVNAAKILEEAPQADTARNKLEKEFSGRNKKLIDGQKELKALEDKLAKDGAVMSDAERAKSERNINALRRDLKRDQDEAREDFNIRRNEEFSKLQKQVYEAIVALAKQENYDLIVGDGAIYSSERVDITDKVMARLKAGAPEAAKGGATEPAAQPKQ